MLALARNALRLIRPLHTRLPSRSQKKSPAAREHAQPQRPRRLYVCIHRSVKRRAQTDISQPGAYRPDVAFSR
jgi:hypothetical protein